MKMDLDDVAVRILACLAEKELTTPEYYPLSLNALTNACNQKSNRAPVMSMEETDVIRGLDFLGTKGLARLTTDGGRVAKYCHSMADKLGLAASQRAILAELMLRGPQTAGELRARAERMTPLADLAAVEEMLQELMNYGPPLVARLPRQPGRKEQRYCHLLSGAPELVVDESHTNEGRVPLPSKTTPGRVQILEGEITTLKGEVSELRKMVEELKSMF